MADQPRQINFTIMPGDDADAPSVYANFCAVGHTPFDFTLTFCLVQPLSEQDLRSAEQNHVVKAPVRTRVVLPVQLLPSLVGALQDQLRNVQESQANVGWDKDSVH